MDPQSNLPLVSIITPVRNGGPMLEALIESVLSQKYPSIEHVVIDDGSDDDGSTVGILRRYEQLRWWSEPWTGQYAAMNLGLRRARGSIVCFISADDLCTPGAVAYAVAYLTGHPEADGVYGKAVYFDQRGQTYPVQIPLYRAPLSWLPYYYFIPHCALYSRRVALEREGLWFDETLRYSGDYEWMMRISRAKLRIGYIPRVMAQVRVHPEQTSQTRSHSIEKERALVDHRYGVSRSLQRLVLSALTLRSASLRLLHALRIGGAGAARDLVRGWLRMRMPQDVNKE